MEKIKERYDTALQTLKTLQDALTALENSTPSDKNYLFICDSTIQRFEYSIDTFWKYLKLYLSEIIKISVEVNSPKLIIREALDAKIINNNEFEIIVQAITRRNITSDAYNKDLALTLIEEIPHYCKILCMVLIKRININRILT